MGKIVSMTGATLSSDFAADPNPKEIGRVELPPVPGWFQDALKNIGGTYKGKTPILRCVSALDPKLQMFACEQWHRKYVGMRDHVTEVTGFRVIWKESGKEEFLLPREAKGYVLDATTMKPKKSIDGKAVILPQIKQETVEHGVPRYVIERFSGPEEFGGHADWEKHRWLDKGDPLNPHPERPFDILGPYPDEGQYVFFCYVENGVEEDGKIVGTEFRELDQGVLDEIAEMVREQREFSSKTPQERLSERVDALESRRDKQAADFKDQIKQEMLPLAHRLLGNARVSVPKLPEGMGRKNVSQ
jgi:hypothetical protein